MHTVKRSLACLLAICSCAALFSLAPRTADAKLKYPRLQLQLTDALRVGGSPLEHSYYACLLNGLEQGLSLDQIREDCALEAIDLSSKGYGDTQLPGEPDTSPINHDVGPFDPASVSMACTSGDPLVSGGGSGQTQSKDPVLYKGSDAVKQSPLVPEDKKGSGGRIDAKNSSFEAYGYGTYGGKGQKDPDTGDVYKGLTREESMDQKAEAIIRAADALEKYIRLRDELIKEQDPAKKASLVGEVAKAKQDWEKALEKAQEDPNKAKGTSMTVDGSTPCEDALQQAREFLYECHRTGWTYPGCASMHAAANHCPDPTEVYVDPDGGYSCMPTIDTEALKDAYVAECEKLVQFGPDGGNPCHPPKFEGKARYAPEDRPDNCKPSPTTYVEPGSASCITVVEIKPFGEPDIQKLYVWALKNFGGPVVVIPERDPKPPVGPGPGPDPTPPQ